MKESFELKKTFNAEPAEIYKAWLDSDLHTTMTGGVAECGDKIGDSFSTWDGYITGENVELIENETIVQSWRTSEFSEKDEDSILTIQLTKIKEDTELILTHSNIPEGETQYKTGWINHYFIPMKEYFDNKLRNN